MRYYKIGEVDYLVGLGNKVCEKPVAICLSHKIYLEECDIERKK